MASQRDPRLNPSLLNSRYVILTHLRKALEALIQRHVAGRSCATALDVGAASAPYRPLIEPHVGRYHTVDLPGQGADYEVRPNGRIPLPDGFADLVLSSQVLEHVDDPLMHLQEVRRLLTPAGTVVLSTHGHWMYHPTPEDYWRWTGPGLHCLMERAGFRVMEIVGVLGLAASGLQLLHDGISTRVPRLLRPTFAVLFQGLITLADLLDPSDRTKDACVFVVAARKLGP